jgi:2-keto-3-deoxy-L-rhamnonate aldolase RhmA
VWIDLEHGALGPLDAQEMILGAQAAGTFALVRLPADAHALMATMLDAGADGVVIGSRAIEVAEQGGAEALEAFVADVASALPVSN